MCSVSSEIVVAVKPDQSAVVGHLDADMEVDDFVVELLVTLTSIQSFQLAKELVASPLNLDLYSPFLQVHYFRCCSDKFPIKKNDKKNMIISKRVTRAFIAQNTYRYEFELSEKKM